MELIDGNPHIFPPTHDLIDFSPRRGLHTTKKYNKALVKIILIVRDFNSNGINKKQGRRKITHLNLEPETRE